MLISKSHFSLECAIAAREVHSNAKVQSIRRSARTNYMMQMTATITSGLAWSYDLKNKSSLDYQLAKANVEKMVSNNNKLNRHCVSHAVYRLFSLKEKPVNQKLQYHKATNAYPKTIISNIDFVPIDINKSQIQMEIQFTISRTDFDSNTLLKRYQRIDQQDMLPWTLANITVSLSK